MDMPRQKIQKIIVLTGRPDQGQACWCYRHRIHWSPDCARDIEGRRIRDTIRAHTQPVPTNAATISHKGGARPTETG
jgi:hypothetical protein